MIFDNPWCLLLLLLLIPAIVWYVLKHKKAQAAMNVSSTEAFDKMPRTYKAYLRHVVFALRLLAIACVIVVLARPMTTDSWQKSSTEGVDVVVALDISGSMLSRDFSPNRLEAAKTVAAPVAAPTVEPEKAPGSAGSLKTYDVPPKTCAMLMAIVADKMGKPLNELRFISIKEVKE